MTMLALPVHIALVDETGTIQMEELARVAGALNEQINRDFAPVWYVRASVGAYPQAPPNTWAVKIVSDMSEPGALGYHTDADGQPYACVLKVKDWPSVASHEALEMLADPWGKRPHGGRLPAGFEHAYKDLGLKTEHSLVRYLLEVCDPPEATSYEIGGVAVSDFIKPDWYHANVRVHDSYSFAGGCRSPREVAEGGYVSFSILERNGRNRWYQVFNFSGPPVINDIGFFDDNALQSLREWTDVMAAEFREANGR